VASFTPRKSPCPCGYQGDQVRECTCTPFQVQRYRSRLSGPLLDRIDMHIEVPAVQVKELIVRPDGESSAVIRKRVNRARILQRQRFAGVAKSTAMRR
jgi:magnesium chelatase family protein